MVLQSFLESAPLLGTINSYERQRHFAHSESDQSPTQRGNNVVLLLGHAGLDDVEFGFIQADAVIKSTRIGCACFSVWQKDFGGAVFQNHIGDIGVTDIAQLLGGYYGTALHELAHWTGHQSRLNRSTLTDAYRFGDANYAREELRAELASVFLAAERGIPHDPASHAAYVGSWVKALREDKNEIFRAAHDASAAADYLLSLERERSIGEALAADPTSIEPGQREAALEDETAELKLKQEATVLGEAVDKVQADATTTRTEDERDSTRTTRYEPGNGTVLAHEKQGGDDRRTVVDAGMAQSRLPGSEDLRQSFRAANELTARALGDGAKTHAALTDSGVYRGTIIGETDLHVVQRLSSSSAVAHMKHLLGSAPALGESVCVAYSQSRAEVRELRQRTKTQGLAR